MRTASRCDEALAHAADAAPDYLVVEQDLGDGTGLELFGRLRALQPRLAGVMVSRAPSIAHAVESIRAGFLDYRTTAVDCGRLLDLFEEVEGGARPTDAGREEAASLARVQAEHIRAVLYQTRGNVSQAARVLGLHRRSLQRRLLKEPDGLVRASFGGGHAGQPANEVRDARLEREPPGRDDRGR